GQGDAAQLQLLQEAEANALLGPMGLQLKNGTLIAVDGKQEIAISSAQPLPSIYNGTQPVLPSITSKASAPQLTHLSERTSLISMHSGACLTWMALAELARTSMSELADAKAIRQAFQQQKLHGKDREIKATQEKISAEKQAAFEQLAFSIAAAVVSAALMGA